MSKTQLLLNFLTKTEKNEVKVITGSVTRNKINRELPKRTLQRFLQMSPADML